MASHQLHTLIIMSTYSNTNQLNIEYSRQENRKIHKFNQNFVQICSRFLNNCSFLSYRQFQKESYWKVALVWYVFRLYPICTVFYLFINIMLNVGLHMLPSELLVKRKSNFLRKFNSCCSSIVCHFGFGKYVKCVCDNYLFFLVKWIKFSSSIILYIVSHQLWWIKIFIVLSKCQPM